MKELLVRTKNPEALDKTLKSLGGLVEQNLDGTYPFRLDNIYAVRSVSGDIGFLKFSIKNQGYAEIVGEREII